MSGIPAGAGSLLGKRLGKYEILALLALGGTAEIYLARIGGTAGFEKYVVVKCLHDHLADDTEFVKMFLDEARLAAMLDHSNVVQTFELGEHENRYYMVMEFLAGLSLAMVVRRAGERLPGGVMPVPLILNAAAQAAAGLHYAHERTTNGKPLNMVHRDISPQNLVVSFEGVVKVVDFGIARAEYRETKTKAGTIKGKFAYMSPEQCVANNVDRRTDVFALGVIVHELVTGRRLFKRNSPYETYQAVIECAVAPPSAINNQLDPALDEIVMKAVAKDKDSRYPTAEAFGDAMLGYLHHRGKGSGPGELGRFFDASFSQEIEEHGERMRELISGREVVSVDKAMGWDDEDEAAAKKAQQTVDLGGRDSAVSLDTGDVMPLRPSEASLEQVVSNLGGGDEESDAPADRTRIEANPLDKLKELDSTVANRGHGPTPVPTGSVSGGPAPLPAPPTGPVAQVKIPSVVAPSVPAPIVRPPGAPKAAEKFPNRANMPTQIADDLAPSPENARTQLAGQPLDVGLAQTQAHMDAVAPPPDENVPPAGPYSATQGAVRRSEIQRAIEGALSGPADPGPQGGSLYPVVQGGRPFNADLAPSNIPPPQRSPLASAPPPQYDPQHAANLMSPVGQHYPNQVDWDAAAARSAKALPPWQLALLFVGAIGAALLVTIILVKIFH